MKAGWSNGETRTQSRFSLGEVFHEGLRLYSPFSQSYLPRPHATVDDPHSLYLSRHDCGASYLQYVGAVAQPPSPRRGLRSRNVNGLGYYTSKHPAKVAGATSREKNIWVLRRVSYRLASLQDLRARARACEKTADVFYFDYLWRMRQVRWLRLKSSCPPTTSFLRYTRR